MCSKQHFGLKYIYQTRSSTYRFWTLSNAYSDFCFGNFALYFHNCNYVSKATSSSKTFSLKKALFPNPLPFWRGVFSCFGPKIYGSVDKSALFMSEGHFMEKKHFEKKIKLNIYRFWANCCWDLAWSFNRVTKISQFVLEDFFEQKHLFGKKSLITELFSNCERKISGRIFKKLPRSPEVKFHCKKIHFKKSCFFWVYAEVYSGRLVKTFW